MDDQELRALAFLAIRVRRATMGAGPWDEAGLMANLRKIQDRNLHMSVEHVLRHAADPEAKSPGVILGSFTPAAPTPTKQSTVPKAREACARCGQFRGNCHCDRERLADDHGEQPTVLPGANAATARELLRNRRAS